MPEREDGWDDPADEGWGGTANEAWGSGAPATPAYGSPPAAPTPPAYPTPPPTSPESGYPTAPGYGAAPGYQPTQGYPPAPPPPSSGGNRKGWLYGGAAAVVVAVVVAIVLLASSGGGKPKANPTPSPPVSTSASPSTSPSPTPSPTPTPTLSAPAGTGLAAIAPFTGCTDAPRAEFNTPKVVEQIVCTGSSVTSKVPALGVSYAKFPTTADLNSWYQSTILSSNGIKPSQGTCGNGTLVSTTRGAQYCEGAFTDDTGSTARQVLVEAPSTIELTNGPNSTNANCPGQSFTLLVFTSPSDNVGVVALGCPASPVTAKSFETSLNNGDFDLND